MSVLVRLPKTGPVLLAIDAMAQTLGNYTPENRPMGPFDLDESGTRASTRMAPLVSRNGEAWVPGFRGLVVPPLDDYLRAGERRKTARVIPVKVRGDKVADILRTAAKMNKLIHHKVVLRDPGALVIGSAAHFDHLRTEAGVHEDHTVIHLDR